MREGRHSLKVRFASHPADTDQQRRMSNVREMAHSFADYIAKNVAAPDEVARALDCIEQAMMLANAGIAREQAGS